MRTTLANMCTGVCFSCMPCSPANANTTWMPIAKCCPNGYLTRTHAGGSQELLYSSLFILCFPMETVRTDDAPMLSCGRNGTGPARAPFSRLAQKPKFACSQIHTLQPSGPTSADPFHQTTYQQKTFRTFFFDDDKGPGICLPWWQSVCYLNV
jgi:hypothetical protein